MFARSAIFETWRLRWPCVSWAPRLTMVALFVVLAGAGAASAATVKRLKTPPAGDYSITAGADGNLWLDSGAAIARVTPSGAFTEFSDGLSEDSESLSLAAGPDGNVWFTDFGTNSVGRITPSGKITKFSAGIPPHSGPLHIAAGPDGNMWFTEPTSGRVARITPTGTVTQFSAGVARGLSGITAGPDGNVWFGVLGGGARIGRVTPSGDVTKFSAGLRAGSSPSAFTAGPDGNVWFTETEGIGRITPSGKITNFSAGISPGGHPTGIAAGADGNLWFTERDGGRLGRITPEGKITEFSAGIPSGELLSTITSGPDASLWFPIGDGIARLTPTPGTAVSVLTHRARVNAHGATTVKLACGTGSELCAGRLYLTIRVAARRGHKDAYTVRKTVVLASARIALSPGQHASVKLALNAIGRRRLARAKGQRLTTRYRASSSAGDAQGTLTLTALRGAPQGTG